jgi:hypothetical protein
MTPFSFEMEKSVRLKHPDYAAGVSQVSRKIGTIPK